MPGCTLLVYLVLLVTDLVVGGSIIVWKCSFRKSEEECELAIGGTIGSVFIWLVIMFVCPCFATRCEICITLENVWQKCVQYMEKLRPRQSHNDTLEDVVHRPSTDPLLYKGQGLSAINGDAVQCSKIGLHVYICNEKREGRIHKPAIKYPQFDDP